MVAAHGCEWFTTNRAFEAYSYRSANSLYTYRYRLDGLPIRWRTNFQKKHTLCHLPCDIKSFIGLILYCDDTFYINILIFCIFKQSTKYIWIYSHLNRNTFWDQTIPNRLKQNIPVSLFSTLPIHCWRWLNLIHSDTHPPIVFHSPPHTYLFFLK